MHHHHYHSEKSSSSESSDSEEAEEGREGVFASGGLVIMSNPADAETMDESSNFAEKMQEGFYEE